MDLILSFLYGYSVIHIPFIKKSIFSPMTWVTVLTWNKFLFASESISRLLFCSTGLSLHVPVWIDLVTPTSYFLISNSVKPPSPLFFYRIFQALFEIITIAESLYRYSPKIKRNYLKYISKFDFWLWQNLLHYIPLKFSNSYLA